VRYWNAAAESLFGYARVEALGRTLHQLVLPPTPVGAAEGPPGDAVEAGRKTLETIRRCKDGALIYVHLSVRALHDPAGVLLGHLHSQADVTHLKVQRDAR